MFTQTIYQPRSSFSGHLNELVSKDQRSLGNLAVESVNKNTINSVNFNVVTRSIESGKKQTISLQKQSLDSVVFQTFKLTRLPNCAGDNKSPVSSESVHFKVNMSPASGNISMMVTYRSLTSANSWFFVFSHSGKC